MHLSMYFAAWPKGEQACKRLEKNIQFAVSQQSSLAYLKLLESSLEPQGL